jgi:hypothetical protein
MTLIETLTDSIEWAAIDMAGDVGFAAGSHGRDDQQDAATLAVAAVMLIDAIGGDSDGVAEVVLGAAGSGYYEYQSHAAWGTVALPDGTYVGEGR